jgi:hypothetical protein
VKFARQKFAPRKFAPRWTPLADRLLREAAAREDERKLVLQRVSPACFAEPPHEVRPGLPEFALAVGRLRLLPACPCFPSNGPCSNSAPIALRDEHLARICALLQHPFVRCTIYLGDPECRPRFPVAQRVVKSGAIIAKDVMSRKFANLDSFAGFF